MANLNLFELETCLDDLQKFMSAHPRAPYTAASLATVRRARERFVEQERETDTFYTRWRREGGEQRSRHKQMQRRTKQLQKELKLLGADGWPTGTVNYLDEDDTRELTAAMADYLDARRDEIDFAASAVDELRKLLDEGREIERETIEARESWRRIALQRKLAIDQATDAIVAARDRIVEALGASHEEVGAIRWPATLAPT